MKIKLWNFVKELEPRLLSMSVGRFNVLEGKKTFNIECELSIGSNRTELKKCKVDKESFENGIKDEDSIIFY